MHLRRISPNPSPVASDPAMQPVYVTRQIDPRHSSLVRDKLRVAVREAQQGIRKRAGEITFDNRFNRNRTSVESQIIRMWEEEIEALVAKCYEILCHHWGLLGHARTGAFVRYSFAILERTIGRLASSAAHEAGMAHRRRGSLGRNFAEVYKNSGSSIRDRWLEKLDLEARDLDLAACTKAKQSSPVVPLRNVSNKSGNALSPVKPNSSSPPEFLSLVGARDRSSRQSATARSEPASEQVGQEHASRTSKSVGLLSKYRSELKRAILIQLTKNPRARDVEVCRGLDADGAVEIPQGWKASGVGRSFAKAYLNPELRRRIEIAISKIRSDLRECRLLDRR